MTRPPPPIEGGKERSFVGPVSQLERLGGSSQCCRGGRLHVCVPRGPIGEHIEGFTVTGWFVLFIKPLRQEGAARFLAHDIHVNLPHVSAAPLSAKAANWHCLLTRYLAIWLLTGPAGELTARGLELSLFGRYSFCN